MVGRFDTILWDVDGTLLDFAAAEGICIHHCLSLQGKETGEEQVAVYRQINHDYWKRFERGEITREFLYPGRFSEWFEKMGWKGLDPVKMNEDYQLILGSTPVLYPDTLPVLRELSGHIRQYVVTNGSTVAQEGKLEKSGIGKLMDGVFISERVGAPKPEKKFFDICTSEIPDYDPDRTVIVGDSLTSDIKGGNNAGITCIWFNPTGQKPDGNVRIDAEIRKLSEMKEILKNL